MRDVDSKDMTALFMKGCTDDAATRNPIMEKGMPFPPETFSSSDLAMEARDVKDDGN
jgi:hypothetical protein